jgi:carbonic anhydrase
MDQILHKTEPARQKFFSNNRQLLQELAEVGQYPSALFIGCSDSRVVPEQLLGGKPGDFFMLRNIANLVPPYWQTEVGIVSVLEFTVLDLEIPHIIVCGHTDCGGIMALDQELDLGRRPALSRWLDLARPAQREVDGFSTPEKGADSPAERHQAIVERNVVHQLRNLESYPFIRERLENEKLSLHGWVYYLERPEIRYYHLQSDRFVPVS